MRWIVISFWHFCDWDRCSLKVMLYSWSLLRSATTVMRIISGHGYGALLYELAGHRYILKLLVDVSAGLIAGEKDTRELDLNLLSRFASKARVPANPVVEIAIQTAEKLVTTWRRMKHDLPLDDRKCHLPILD